MFSQSLLIRFLATTLAGVVLAAGECENVYYLSTNQLCYGELDDTATDMCTPIPGISYASAMAIHPVTGEFYIVSVLNDTEPEAISGTQTDRYLMKFTASVTGGVPSVDEPETIGSPVLAAESTEKIGALAFTCQGAPQLFGLSEVFDSDTTAYLYQIDYDTGDFTEITSFASSAGDGFSLFYNIETELLYKVAGTFNTDLTSINPFNTSQVIEDIVDYGSWPDSYGFFDNVIGSYFNETHFIATGSSGFLFLASLDDPTYLNDVVTDARAIAANNDALLTDIECYDFMSRCMDTFSEEPSVQPSFQPTSVPSAPTTEPSSVPSTDPSSMPSSDPSSMPTEMPVEAMMTTEDEVMDDTTMEPEATESSSDDPQPTLADSASKNSISFIMVFTAAFGYLFY